VVWGAVFPRNILLASSGGCLKLEVVCLFRIVSTPDVWKGTVSLLFGMKCCHKMEAVLYAVVVWEV